MSFDPKKTEDFKVIFNEVADKIRAFPGCQHLELWSAVPPSTIFLTYSIWESEKALDHYRFSELFKTTWSRTKVLFSAPPVALSLNRAWSASS